MEGIEDIEAILEEVSEDFSPLDCHSAKYFLFMNRLNVQSMTTGSVLKNQPPKSLLNSIQWKRVHKGMGYCCS